MSVITKKICLLGNFNVGKTSLIRRFVEDKFSDQYLSTVGVKVSRKSVNIKTDSEIDQINLLVWDLEGNTKFKSIISSYLKGASAAIIVADLTRLDTLNNLNNHIDRFSEVNPQSTIVISLNKADLVAQEKLNKLSQAYNFDSEQVIATYITSAKTGKEVTKMFAKISQAIALCE